MNFLAPLFLAGALAVALPLVFHLIRRTTKERTRFSSLMFLKPTPPRLTRRSKLENILLLILRCAAICLLAAGFARPFVKQVLPESPTTAAAKVTVVLVDTSASMRRADLWSQARAKVDSILREAMAGDRMALFTFDRQLSPVVTFEEWSRTTDRTQLASSRLAEIKPGWAATSLDQAILRAAEILADADTNNIGGRRQIVVVSDFQSGSRLSALQGQDWAKGVEVVSERVTTKTSNASLQLLADANATGQLSNTVRVRISNAADSQRDQFQVGWALGNGSFLGKAAEAYVPAGQSRIVSLPWPEDKSAAHQVVLRGDQEEFDNTAFYAAAQAVRVRVLYFGSEPPTNAQAPLYFITRAFQPTPQLEIEMLARQPAASVEPEVADTVALFIVSEALPQATAALVRGQMERGKTVLFAPKSADAAVTLGMLLQQASIPMSEVEPRNYAMVGEIDFQHPLFAPFADARYSDFTKIRFWKYRQLDASQIPAGRVVAKFDNGDPAILEVPAGRGRLIHFAFSWSPADSQLALSTKFVPLMHSALDLGGVTAPMAAGFSVGDTVPLPIQAGSAEGPMTVMLPDGIREELAAGATNFTGATQPGIYAVTRDNLTRQFAVNLDANEGRTVPLPMDELERLGVPAHPDVKAGANNAQAKQQLKDAELESHQRLWRWFVVATLAILILETGIAGWTALRTSTQTEVAV